MNLSYKHRHDGGTFVTNFSKEKMPVYLEAVRIYTEMAAGFNSRFEKRNLVVSEISTPPAPRDYGGSLHLVGGVFDLSDFWTVFDVVEKTHDAVHKAAKEAWSRPGWRFIASLPDGESFVSMCVHKDSVYIATNKRLYRVVHDELQQVPFVGSVDVAREPTLTCTLYPGETVSFRGVTFK